MITLSINGIECTFRGDPEMPLLWVLRDHFKLTGTKYGCGAGQCGACTILMDGTACRSCQTRVIEGAGKKIITIEGISEDHPVKIAWREKDVPQCGYCQPGQVVAASALLREKPRPTDRDIDAAMSGILCRCGTYQRIREAIHRAGELMAEGSEIHV